MVAPSHRRAGVRGTPRIAAVLGAILFTVACPTACTVTPESAAPTATPLAEPFVPFASPSGTELPEPSVPTATEAPFLVPAFDGAEPLPVEDGTTHVLKNLNQDASAFHTVEYTIPPGWETGGVYIGKKLGQPGEVAISFWTPSGVYSDPCRRTANLSPIDLAVHTHDDGGELILLGYPRIGLSAQDGRCSDRTTLADRRRSFCRRWNHRAPTRADRTRRSRPRLLRRRRLRGVAGHQCR